MNDSTDTDGHIISEPISEALSKRYLAYALSTITSRALPDVRDGLKPVQRRILYAMRELKLNPEGAYRKCAKIVGEVMGNYHPHGDAAIYATMVRMAQDFAVRYPQVDGQGNFGNIDGDSAAAMRYTESRMTLAGKLLLEGLDEDAVDFRETYDALNEEPVVLPAGLPNLLVNGATGIAVGMATSIAPHNLAEVIDACKLLIRNRNTSTEALMEALPGPDFPTGGVIVEPRANILSAYETGRGSFKTRAKWHIEKLQRGAWQIIVTEIPYQVQKSKLIEDLANIIETNKTSLLGDVNDESAEDVRLVLEPRSKLTDPDVLMESLFRASDLENRFSLNMNVLDRGAPKVMGLRAVLLAYLDHRQEVLVRRSRFRLDKIDKRLHLLEGYLIAFLNIDEVIRIIRTEDEPKPALMARFGVTDIQAEAILNLRLRALRKLEEMEIRKEETALRAERQTILDLLDSEPIQWRKVRDELNAVRKAYGPDTDIGRRRSKFEIAIDVDLEDALAASVPREPLTTILSKQGWIRTIRGHNHDVEGLKFKDGDGLDTHIEMMSHETLVLMSSDGKAFNLEADKLPSGRGHGEPLRLLLAIEPDASIVTLFPLDKGQNRLAASDAGYGFIVQGDALETNRKAGKAIVTVPEGAKLLSCEPVKGDMCAAVSTERKLLVFPLSELPTMEKGKGVKLQNYKGKTGLKDLISFVETEGLAVTQPSGATRSFPEWREWLGKRAGVGKLVMKGFPRSGKFTG